MVSERIELVNTLLNKKPFILKIDGLCYGKEGT